jgi:hypothetical protein
MVLYKIIFTLTLLWSLFHIHALYYTNILQFVWNYMPCNFDSDLYYVSINYYASNVNIMISVLFYPFFGVLNMRNTHCRRVRSIISSYSSSNRTRDRHNATISYQKDRQFLRILLTEIIICIIFDLIHPYVLLDK